jgi:hypothetical protein
VVFRIFHHIALYMDAALSEGCGTSMFWVEMNEVRMGSGYIQGGRDGGHSDLLEGEKPWL